MPVPTKPNEQHKKRDNEFTWESFAKDCVFNQYVLVVGPSSILNTDVNSEAEGNSMKLLLDLVLRQKAYTDSEEGYEEEEYERLKSRIKTFSELVREYNYHSIKGIVLDTIHANDFLPCFDEEIDPSLMKLLKTKCFRIVLTTTIDPYLEIAMEKVWGKGGFDIVQIENAQQSFKRVTFDEFGITRPTLCYVLGKIDAEKTLSENRFTLSENDIMEKISSWFENHNNNSFLRFIRKLRLVSVGCQFDDWMFRFFWFLLRGRIDSEANGQVAVEIKEDVKLKKYLENEKIMVFEDSRAFMNKAADYIDKAVNMDMLPRKDRGVFISYAHEDRYIALPLFERLLAAGVNVWIDERLECGDVYDNRIFNAINTCKVFMPILSSQVKTDIVENRINERWYRKEWQWAQTRLDNEDEANEGGRSMKVIPLVVGDYRFNEDYHQKVPKCIVEATAFETAKDSMENLISIINK